jgi:hypothetical protein
LSGKIFRFVWTNFQICLGKFSDLSVIFFGFVSDIFWICQWYFLDLSMMFFGFVRDIFWICPWSFLDLSVIFSGFLNNFYVFLGHFFKISVVFPSNDHIVAWVTRPEGPKGAKDEVKPARRATN